MDTSLKTQLIDYDDNPNISIYELFDLDYLYHATYKPYLEEIRKSGSISPSVHSNWDISDNSLIYLSRDPDDAASFAETSDNIPEDYLDQIVVLKIDPEYLDFKEIDIDHNQYYSYEDSVDVEDPSTWIDFEYEGKIPLKAIVEVIPYG